MTTTERRKQTVQLRLPPHSIEAEQSVIGGLLLDNDVWDKIIDVLNAGDFYRQEHRTIWTHIERIINSSHPADVITVHESLSTSGDLEKVGGMDYLNSLAHNIPSTANVHRYAEIVREHAMLRKLIHVADEIASTAVSPQGREARQLLDEAEAKVFQIAQEGARRTADFQELQPLVAQVLKRIDELYHQEGGSDITGVPSGFIDIDKLTSGMQPGDLIIVAGRPSMGKTSFAMNIGEHVAIEQGLPVAIFSMEMAAVQLATRMLGSVGVLDQHRVRTGKLTSEDWPRITRAVQLIQDAQIYIDETPMLNAIELRARARRLARRCGRQMGLIIIDYLQLMSSHSVVENRATEISGISRSLKSLSKEMGCPVIALSQLNRGLEQRPNKRPVMSDLRESGAIEQDADLILFIYRDEVYNPDSPDRGTAEIIIGKQRNGPTGTVKLTFQGNSTRFFNFTSKG